MKKKLIVATAGALIGVLALSSGAVAAQHYLITSSSQIKDGTIAARDLTLNARKSLKGHKGDTGDRGPQGVQGPKGETGKAAPAAGPKPTGYEVRTWRYSKDDANSDMGPGYVGVGSGAIATVACSPGKVAVGGGYRFTSPGADAFNSQAVSDGSGVVASFPGRMDWNATPPVVKPNNNTGWIVQVNNKVNLADMTMYVICVNAN